MEDHGIKKSRVRLEIHASRLKGSRFHSKAPFAVVTLLSSDPLEKPIILGRTEAARGRLSPRWTEAFHLEYEIGKETRVNIGVYDELSMKEEGGKPMGSAMFEVGEVLGARGNTKAKKLRRGGTLFARVTVAKSKNLGHFHFKFQGKDLSNTERPFGTSNPFFEVSSRIHVGGRLAWLPILRSEVVSSDLCPVWETTKVSLDRLANDDGAYLDHPLLVSVYHRARNGNFKFMGHFESNARSLLAATNDNGSGTAFMLERKERDVGSIVVLEAFVDNEAPISDSVDSAAAACNDQESSTGENISPLELNDDYAAAPPTSPMIMTPAIPEKEPPSVENMHHPDAGTKDKSSSGDISDDPAVEVDGKMQQETPPSIPDRRSLLLVDRNSTEQSMTLDDALGMMSLDEKNAVESSSTTLLPSGGPIPRTSFGSSCSEAVTEFEFLPEPEDVTSTGMPTFIDYITGGCELELSIAIDFTGSNGDPRIPGTLHHIHQNGQFNDYEKAITAVGGIVSKYDSSQKYSVYGFGAKFGGEVQHCFQVGGSDYVHGIGGVIQAYRSVFQMGFDMSRPTVFSDCIDVVAASARAKQAVAATNGSQAYRVLLILTDGCVSDPARTQKSLQRACDAPLSIVIVGIGSTDFSSMRMLDDCFNDESCDKGRDICNFVEFAKFAQDRTALTRQTLAEIPFQLVEYFYRRGIMPRISPRSSISSNSIVAAEPNKDDVDLSIAFLPDGQVSLRSFDGAIYNDKLFDSASRYVEKLPTPNPPTPLPPVPSPAPPTQAPLNLLHIHVPDGVYPGMQLQVLNPSTQQMLLVTVPSGVGPGGIIAVQY